MKALRLKHTAVLSIQTFSTRGATKLNMSLGTRILYSIPHGYGNIDVMAKNVKFYNNPNRTAFKLFPCTNDLSK